jgi:hypothetical protein
MHAYIAAAAIAEARKGWLFRSSLGHTATALTERSIDQKTPGTQSAGAPWPPASSRRLAIIRFGRRA